MFHPFQSNRFSIEDSRGETTFNFLIDAINNARQSQSCPVIKFNDMRLGALPQISTYVTGIHPSLHKVGSPISVIKAPSNLKMGLEEYAQDFGRVQGVVKLGREHDLQRDWMNWGNADDREF